MAARSGILFIILKHHVSHEQTYLCISYRLGVICRIISVFASPRSSYLTRFLCLAADTMRSSVFIDTCGASQKYRGNKYLSVRWQGSCTLQNRKAGGCVVLTAIMVVQEGILSMYAITHPSVDVMWFQDY